MKVICVCGVGCVGKSQYCKDMMSGYKIKNKSRPILLQLGKFFRNTIGPDFFKNLENPSAPLATESWVRNMVHFSLTFGHNYNSDVIIDGFPRTKEQLFWLMDSSLISTFSIIVDLRFLYVGDSVLYDRINKRKKEDPNGALLTESRMLKDAALVRDVHSVASSSVFSETHPTFKMEEIDL